MVGVSVASIALGWALHSAFESSSSAAAKCAKSVVDASSSSSSSVASSVSSVAEAAVPVEAASLIAAPAPAPATAFASAASAPTPSTPAAPLRRATAAEVMAAQELEEELLSDSPHVGPGGLKMVICVRTDLEMSKGKIAAQVGHAVLGAVRVAGRLPLASEWLRAWLFRAQAKITLKVESEEQMDAVAAAAAEAGLPFMIIEDAGRTEVEPGTRTVVGIGPAPVDIINSITGPKGRFPLRLLS